MCRENECDRQLGQCWDTVGHYLQTCSVKKMIQLLQLFQLELIMMNMLIRINRNLESVLYGSSRQWGGTIPIQLELP